MGNVGGFAPVHNFIFVSSVFPIFSALGAMLYGCSASMQAGGGKSSEYTCSEVENALFIEGDLYQVALWSTLVVVALHKPPKRTMLFVFSPFVVMTFVMAAL